ncbi:MAG: histidine kinase [Lachnospiraceae bacterium]|nr:histidine kinase [Lachnospiraceae bacterium]
MMFSLKKQISRFLIGAILILIALALTLLGVMVQNYQRRERSNHQEEMDSYAETLNNSILQLNDTVGEIYISNEAFDSLKNALSDADTYESVYELLTLFRIQVRSVQNLSGLFTFYNNGDNQVYYVREDMSFEDKEFLKNEGKAILESLSYNYGNMVFEAGDEIYYSVMMKKSLVTIMGVVSLSYGLPESTGEGETYGILYDNQFYGVSGELELTADECASLAPGWATISGRVVYVQKLESYDISVVKILPQSLWLYVSAVHVIVLALFFALVVVLCYLYRFIRNQVTAPLEDMTETLGQLQMGDWEIEFHAPNRLIEIEDVRQTVRLLLQEIEQYKIRSYEERLEMQTTQLQYYKLQLAPHFYTNCLKNAYYMLMLKEYESAERFLMCLSAHLRYLLQKDVSLVEAQKERDFVENYIKLQNLMGRRQILCELYIADDLPEQEIPILSMQTFVENSVKYADDTGKRNISIHISLRKLIIEGQEVLDMRVTDNGIGYPEEVLHMLNQSEPVEEKNLGVGVINLLSRMRIQYGQEAGWYFENENGAVSELFIPVKKRKEPAQ